jgi:Xaa-Pro aminopeptidase
MNPLHPLGILTDSPEKLEGVALAFLTDGLHRARTKTIEGLEIVRRELREGMTELEARKLALRVFTDLGMRKHWHQPWIRFGKGTTLTFSDPLSEHRLKPGAPYLLDLGPVWSDGAMEYEGDYGDTFIFGEATENADAARCAETARRLFREARAEWREHRRTGYEIYELLRHRATEEGYQLLEEPSGHRVSDFPHHKYTKGSLAKVPFTPQGSLWVLEVHLVDRARRFGAFFEDLL